MINIISRSYLSNNVSGPQKVVKNFIKGLEALGYPYVVNQRLDACRRLWIHDDVYALKFIKNLPSNIHVVIGPNLFIKPSNIPKNIDIKRAVFLYPSQWIKNFWVHFGYTGSAMEVWPAGIDTDDFYTSRVEKKLVMLYFKQRYREELKIVENLLNDRHIEYKLIVYRKYDEKEFRDILTQSKYGIWLGRQESQGIALEEALACGVPLLVWDVDSLGHWDPPIKEKKLFTDEESGYKLATVAEYFDSTCGIKVTDSAHLGDALETMEGEWKQFNPRQYILNNLDYKKQARDLLQVYHEYYGLDFESGFMEEIIWSGSWVNDRFHFKMFVKLKDLIRNIINIWKNTIV
ncbi:MAG: glycosyltransferase [Candidatus Magasanikbacteria bacterium]